MKFLRQLFRRQPKTFPAPSVDVLIARRAVRVCNRNTEAVSAYQRVHAILGARKC